MVNELISLFYKVFLMFKSITY